MTQYSTATWPEFNPAEHYMDVVPCGHWPLSKETYDMAVAEVQTAVRAFIPKEYWHKIHWGVVPYRVTAITEGTGPAIRWKYDPRGF
jgi:hypothetical protein